MVLAKIWACSQPPPMQQILPKTAQNCQNLPKYAQRQNFKISPKFEILVFLKNKNFYV
jgi:hypothetical protein